MMTATDWLKDNGPTGEDEAQAAAQALMRRRREDEALEALEGLSRFERQLAEHAYRAGMNVVRDALKAAIGPAAVTVDAEHLRRLDVSALYFDRGARDVRFGQPADPRAAALVWSALDYARREAAHELAQRAARETPGTAGPDVELDGGRCAPLQLRHYPRIPPVGGGEAAGA